MKNILSDPNTLKIFSKKKIRQNKNTQSLSEQVPWMTKLWKNWCMMQLSVSMSRTIRILKSSGNSMICSQQHNKEPVGNGWLTSLNKMSIFVLKWLNESDRCESSESWKIIIFKGFSGLHKKFLHLIDTIRRAGKGGHTQGDTTHAANSRGGPAGDIHRPGRRRDTEKILSHRWTGRLCPGICAG